MASDPRELQLRELKDMMQQLKKTVGSQTRMIAFPAGIPGCGQPARSSETGNDRVSEKAALRGIQRKTQKAGRAAGGRSAHAL